MPDLSVRDFQAVGDGRTKDTAAVQAAIDAAASGRGPSTVTFPPGTYLCGTLRLASRICLDIQPGATLLASPDAEDFVDRGLPEGSDPFEDDQYERRRHFLSGVDVEQVTIRGGGVIDGNLAHWSKPPLDQLPLYKWVGFKPGRYVPMISLRDCRDVRLTDVTIRNSPGWTVHLRRCDRVWVRGVRLYNHVYAGNSDGFDVDGCRDVLFADCHIETGDDCIVLKTLPGSRSCERVTIANCVLKTSCAAVKLGTESVHDFREIAVTGCVVYESSRAFQMVCRDGGTMEDIAVSNLTVNTNAGITMARPIHIDLGIRHKEHPIQRGGHGKTLGRIRRVTISNVTMRTDGRILITGGDGGRISQIRLSDIHLHMPWIEDPVAVKDLSDRMQSSPGAPEARLARAAVVAAHVDDLQIRGLSVTWPDDELAQGYLPKYENGQLVRDPRTDFEPMPAFHAFWGQALSGGLLDVPGLTGSTPETEPIHLQDSTIRVRD